MFVKLDDAYVNTDNIIYIVKKDNKTKIRFNNPNSWLTPNISIEETMNIINKALYYNEPNFKPTKKVTRAELIDLED